MNKRLFSILFAAVLVFALAACMPGQPLSSPAQTTGSGVVTRTLNVSGSGRVTLAPDVAYVYIGVNSQNENVSAALTENNSKAQAVSGAIKELGIDAKDIQTSSFNIVPQQQYSPEGKVTGVIYNVDNTVNVTVRNLSVLGKLLDAVVRAGANSINGINFDVLDKSQAITQARKLAIQDAHDQAQELATAAGVTLGDVQTLNAMTNAGPVPLYEAKGAAAIPSVPVSAGQMVISVDVNVVYEIK